jgi:ABC-type multidrug transport system permease subunit
MRSTIIWTLVVGVVVALILVITAVSLSASGFRLDVERWVLIGAFLVIISMATAVMVSVLNTLKDVRQQTAGDTAGGLTGNDSGDTRPGTSS